MATIKLLIWKHDRKKDGSFPIAIRITKDRKTRYMFTGEYVFEKDWDVKKSLAKKSHPNSARLNNLLQKKLSEAHATVLEVEASSDDLSSNQIKKKVKRKSSNVSFFQLASERVKNKYMEGVFSVAKSELSILHNIQEFLNFKPGISKQKTIEQIAERRRLRVSKARKGEINVLDELKGFAKNKTLGFEDVNTAFINRYKSFCSAYLQQSTRTVTNQLIFIRTVYNLAINESIIDNKNYPFAGEKERIRIRSGNKIGLTKEEVARIEALELEAGASIWHTRNVWLFAFYFAGVRISDVLEMKWSDFVDGRLFYQMNKNEKPVSLKIPSQATRIMELYLPEKQRASDFVFPFLKKANLKSPEDMFVKVRNATKLLNKYLKRIAIECDIDKNLSNHIARHSFGNIAGDAIHPLMLQKLYRHTDIQTTINYQANFIHREADEALESVLNS